jgi:hypothetical protein
VTDPVALFRVLLLLGVANGAPVFATKLLGKRYSAPLDFGYTFPDGRALLGPGKTIRGILVALVATAAAGVVLGFTWRLGAALAAASMAGDLISSFTKRRLGLASHAQAFGLDQLPEALLPLVLLQHRLGLSWLDIAVVTASFVAGEIVLSRVLFRLGVRDRPY